MDSGRLDTFSDGVFAVAITLLVLNLHVRGPGHGSLLHQFGDLWPAHAALCVSFFVIGAIWVHHHSLFKPVAIVDRPLMAFNLLLLPCVIVFPFPTATLATYLRYGGSDPHIAAAVDGLVVEGVGLTSFAITTWLIRQRLLDAAVSLSAARAAERRYAGGALAIALAIGLAFISAVLAHGDRDVFPRSPRSIRQSLTRHRDNLTRALGVLFRQPASIPPERRRSQARTP